MQPLIGCIGDEIARASTERSLPPGEIIAVQPSTNPMTLRGRRRFGLFLVQRWRLSSGTGRADRWVAQIAGYEYRLEDREEREVLAFHWHPEGMSHVTEPHLHLSAASSPAALPDLARAHLPTGTVALRAVVRSLLRDFGVAPQRDDWQRVLTEP